MKNILFAILIIPSFVFAQNDTIPSSQKSIYNGDVNIEIPIKIVNGHGDSVTVSFLAYLPVETWNDLVRKNGNNEFNLFHSIVQNLSDQAQRNLNNPDSFDPLKQQVVRFNDGKFRCLYKMMGRNGYGNLIETSIPVTYEP